MVSGTFKSDRSHDGEVQKFATSSTPLRRQNFRPKTILESCISSIPSSPKFAKTRSNGTNFRRRTQINLPHPDLGSNRHGESIMFDRIHA
jgi:hypothetical protein